jgi:hypothetical protein
MKNILVKVLLSGALSLIAGVAIAKDVNGKCLLQVDGKNYIDGKCPIIVDKDSITIGVSKRTSTVDYFATIFLDDDNKNIGEGYWNEEKHLDRAQALLGTLKRNGECWENEKTKICAWASNVTSADEGKVIVPDVTDCSLDADKILKKSGLVPKRIQVHGPIDKDAADIGCPYRQQPKAGTSVKKGTKVTYRSWWEAG